MKTLTDIIKQSQTIYTNGHTFEEYKAWKDYLINNPEEVKAIISKETIATLSKYCYRKENKPYMVKSVYSSIVQHTVLADSFGYSPFEETFEAAIKRTTDAYTEQDYLNYKAKIKAKQEEREKALTNPETLDEFRTFISRRGAQALSEEQRIRYDELTADQRKESKKEIVKPVSTDVDMQIIENFHAKKQVNIYVVKLSDRVERSTYEELNSRAKKLGGYYSSYNKQGAIPGFIFDTLEQAQQFTQVEQATEVVKDSKAQALRERGEKLQQEGEAELNQDRQANTHRRAAMAENAERKASAKIKFGKELQAIAQAMDEGKIKYLDKVSNGKDLEELKNILVSASYRQSVQEKNNREVNIGTVNYSEIPYPIIYRSTAPDLLKMADVEGKKLASARMLKRLGSAEQYTVSGTAALEDYETLFCTRCRIIDEWRIDRFKEQLMRLKRVKRLGIDSPEELRVALREYITLTTGANITKEQQEQQELKALERQFIGAKIDGFFPTPQQLAREVVDKAAINDGETVLEPSAGLGHLAQEIRTAHPNNSLKLIEYNSRLAEVLSKKGFDVENGSFLDHSGNYDKIVMNPPFENLQDIDHVIHAFSLLNPGGRIVAIMADNKRGDRSKIVEFMQLIDKYGVIEQNEPGAFTTSFRPTGVNTITVVIDKP